MQAMQALLHEPPRVARERVAQHVLAVRDLATKDRVFTHGEAQSLGQSSRRSATSFSYCSKSHAVSRSASAVATGWARA